MYNYRKNMRLSGYDYNQAGGYFVTICTHEKKCTLSNIIPGDALRHAEIQLTQLGQVAEQVLCELCEQYGVRLDACAIMPNHIHIIKCIEERNERVSLGRFVGAFKSIVANRWLRKCNEKGIVMGKVWQRDFYDHILRNEADWMEKIKYINDNPDKWAFDELFLEK